MATANEVITQVPWSALTLRFPAMVGMETLAMVLSSTCMNVPSARAMGRDGERGPRERRWGACRRLTHCAFSDTSIEAFIDNPTRRGVLREFPGIERDPHRQAFGRS